MQVEVPLSDECKSKYRYPTNASRSASIRRMQVEVPLSDECKSKCLYPTQYGACRYVDSPKCRRSGIFPLKKQVDVLCLTEGLPWGGKEYAKVQDLKSRSLCGFSYRIIGSLAKVSESLQRLRRLRQKCAARVRIKTLGCREGVPFPTAGGFVVFREERRKNLLPCAVPRHAGRRSTAKSYFFASSFLR